MVRLVRVVGEEENKEGECLARRQLPLTIEPGLTMVMALEESCMACGLSCQQCGESCQAYERFCSSCGASNKNAKQCPDTAAFLRNLEALPKDERHACLMVTGPEVTATLAQLVSCVGCRRAVENLYQTLQHSGGEALQPLTISQDGIVSISQEHVATPDALARLFVPQAMRLSSSLLGWQGGEGGKARGRRGGSTRCAQHSLGVVVKTLSVTQPTTTTVVRRFLTMGNWLDVWECMETECREQVVLLPFPGLRDTLDQYLTKHSFCSECTNMVNRAYTLLVEEGQEPAKAAGELPMEADSKVNRDGSVNLYSGISACTKEGHVHVECDAQFISQLFTLAEPELSGLRQERHAKTIEIAQKEVLICIGLALFERFQRIQQKIKEGEQTCDLLLLVCLKTLRRSLDMAAEGKRGEADIERLCLELEDAEVKKKEGKRERKRKRRERRRCSVIKKDEKEDSDEGSLHSGGESHQCGNAKAEKEESTENEDKENTPLANQVKPKSMLYHEGVGKQVLGLKPKANNPILSLTAMLEEEEEQEVEEGEAIPMDVIKSFLQRKEETTLRRQELRENLKRRFAALCVSGLT